MPSKMFISARKLLSLNPFPSRAMATFYANLNSNPSMARTPQQREANVVQELEGKLKQARLEGTVVFVNDDIHGRVEMTFNNPAINLETVRSVLGNSTK